MTRTYAQAAQAIRADLKSRLGATRRDISVSVVGRDSKRVDVTIKAPGFDYVKIEAIARQYVHRSYVFAGCDDVLNAPEGDGCLTFADLNA